MSAPVDEPDVHGMRYAGAVRVFGHFRGFLAGGDVAPGAAVPTSDGLPVKAYGNRNAAISVLTASGLFGLKPGEFEWVEQAAWVVALGVWAPPDGQPARVVRNRKETYSNPSM